MEKSHSELTTEGRQLPRHVGVIDVTHFASVVLSPLLLPPPFLSSILHILCAYTKVFLYMNISVLLRVM